jgi:beta-glucanase (GH16 family)
MYVREFAVFGSNNQPHIPRARFRGVLVMLIACFVFVVLDACRSATMPVKDPITTLKEPIHTATPGPAPIPEPHDWKLIWHDEFDSPAIDRHSWTFDIGGDGWGNNESEFYTDRPENARLEDGFLILEARKEDYGGSEYTSARLKTQGLQAWTYGRIEARLKVPFGQGIWPAFWMLGTDIDDVGWPMCGEIDIMEHVGFEPTRVYGTLHGPGYSGAHGVGGKYTLATGTISDSFHTFAVEWEAEAIRWYIDDTLYLSKTSADVAGRWVYDHNFFIILNVAVGGKWPGYPNKTTQFPQRMYVDYVRVYQR